ncbi:MAG: AAA family ATPase [Planctomycetaceae bacterium]|nr:AAA family ATPase [Planctomycetaceae bacterium]
MYTSYWGLNRRPFEERQEAELYFPAASHQTALLKLRYLVEQRKGIAVVAGEHGLGKSLLTQVFERENSIGPVIRLLLPQLSAMETLAYFASRLGCELPRRLVEHRVLELLEDRLAELQRESSHAVLLVDDAHLLDNSHLNALRLLLNLNEQGQADFSIILCGRTQLLGRLQQFEALQTRSALRAAVAPLEKGEILPYVRHRLSVCGAEQEIFTTGALDSLFTHSQGIPRRINQICDLALLVGYVDELNHLGAIEIEAAAEELFAVVAPRLHAA